MATSARFMGRDLCNPAQAPCTGDPNRHHCTAAGHQPPGPKRPQWGRAAQVLTPCVPFSSAAGVRAGLIACSSGTRFGTWARPTPPAPSPASSPRCDAPPTRDSPQSHRAYRTRTRRDHPPVPCRSPWCARPRSGQLTHKCMWTNGAKPGRRPGGLDGGGHPPRH
jgi:hypothetical protein